MGIVTTWLLLPNLPLDDVAQDDSILVEASSTPIRDSQKSHLNFSSVADAVKTEAKGKADELTNPFERHLLDAAVLLSQRVSPTSSEGVRREVRLWRTDFKYPLVREEVWLKHSATDPTVIHKELSVADHVLIKFPEGMSDAMIHDWAVGHGFYVRHTLQTTPVKLIATSEVGLDASAVILNAFREDFPETKGSVTTTAEPDYLVFPTLLPDDTTFGSLWGLHNTGQTGGVADADIDAPEAWNITTGSRDILVGVIDTGVARTHPDLEPNMWVNPGEVAGNGIDDDGNGFVDDVHGWDFFSNDNNPTDEHYHGTHCAGTIGAVGNNRAGVTGVCWQVSMVGIRFLGPNGGATSDAIESVYYATSLGVDLTSNSWGGGGMSSLLQAAIEDAGRHEILFIAAAGNDGTNNDVLPHYPSNYPSANIISVASSTSSDTRSSFSNYGVISVDLAAPGSAIYSTTPGPSYSTLSGTSMATPHVAGAVALAKGIAPLITAADLKLKLMQTVDTGSAFVSNTASGGRLNVWKLIESVAGPYPIITVSGVMEMPGGNGDGIQNPGESLAIQFTATNRGTQTASNVVAKLTSTAGTYSNYVITTDTVNLGTLQPGETLSEVIPFVVMVAADVLTPYSEELLITLQYGSPTELRVQSFNLRVYTSSVVSGRVTDVKDGNILGGATVVLEGPSVVTVNTSVDGEYSAIVTDGLYQVSAHAPGYLKSAQESVPAPPGRAGLDFSLGRPQLRLEPEFIHEEILRGEMSERELSLVNHGSASLEWSLRARDLDGLTQVYELPLAASQSSEVPDVVGSQVSSSVAADSLNAPLNDLSGVTVGAVFTELDRSVLLDDLSGRGASVVTLVRPLTSTSLQEVDAVILDDAIESFSASEIEHLRAAILQGTGLLCEADNSGSLTKARELLAGTGITPIYEGFRDLTLTDIVSHPMTLGVVLLRELAVGWSFDLTGGAAPLVREASGRSHAAVSKLGLGVVVVVGNEISNATNFSMGDGRRFANQIVDGLLAGPEWLGVTPLSGLLAPGQQQKLTVSLDARTVANGRHDAALVISSNIPDEPAQEVPVTMLVQEVPKMVVSVPSLDFGEVIERTEVSQDLWISNEGTMDLVLRSPTLSGSGSHSFSVPVEEVVIEAGAQIGLKVTFLPEAALGHHEAILKLESNDPRRPEVLIPLSGTHVDAPVIGLTPALANLRLSQGQTTLRTFTLRNTGKGILRASAALVFAPSGVTDWAEIEGDANVVIARGKSAKIKVRFHARTHQPMLYQAMLRVTSGDPEFPVVERDLTMTVVAAPVPVFSAVRFDKTYVGQTESQILTLTNQGHADLMLYATRSGNASFRSAVTLPVRVPPGGVRDVLVTFIPRVAGQLESSVVFAANVPGLFFSVPVSGISVKSPAIRVSPSKLTVSTSPGLSQTRVIKVSNIGGEILDWSLEPRVESSEWMRVNSLNAKLSAGEKDEVVLNFDTAQMPSGIYPSFLKLTTNDPNRPEVVVPIVLKVLNRAVLQATPASYELGDVWVGQLATPRFDLTNVGNLPLDILSVTANSSDLHLGWGGKQTLEPGQSVSLDCSYQPSKIASFKGRLTVKTNGGVVGAKTLFITAKVIKPPMMVVQPESLMETVLPSKVKDRDLEVSNPGGTTLDWSAEVINQIGSPSSAGSLTEVLQRLTTRHVDLTALIPNRFDFTEGASGYSIGDGGSNMYDAGNLLSTNLNGGQAVAYSNGTITTDSNLGTASRYFTRKQPGLFMMAADLVGVSTFRIRGGLGADGVGSATGAILRRHGYVGFLKRVSGATTPSVNHLIILPDRAGLAHSFPASTDLDDHDITGLPNSTRIYVLVFASSAGLSISDSQVGQIMDQFLLSIAHDIGTAWLQVVTEVGSTVGEGTSPLMVRLNARSLKAGTYQGIIKVSGNAPATPSLEVPVTLTVPLAAVLEVLPEAINLPDTPVKGTSSLPLTIRNAGSANLLIESLASNDPAFLITSGTPPFAIGAGQTHTLQVKFTPTEARAYAGQLSILSNSADGELTTLPLSGSGLPAPQLQISPTSISLTTRPGVAVSAPITLENLGTAPLHWSFSNTLTTGTLSELSGSLAPGGSKVITLTSFSTASTPPGSSVQSITLTSNDPVRPTVGVIYTRIIQAEPNLLVSPSPVNFGSLLLPGSSQRQIVLRNVGNSLLGVFSISSPSPSLKLLSTTFPIVLTPNSTRTINLQFAPVVPEVLSGYLVFSTNNPIAPSQTVFVSGLAVIPPTISVAPGSLDVTLEEGQSLATQLAIRNDGGSLLSWTATLQPSNASSWIALGQTGGSTEAGSVSYLNVDLLTSQLPPALHSATIRLTSNAVVNGVVSVPVSLRVTPGELAVSTSTLQTTSVRGGAAPSSSVRLIAREGGLPAWTLSSDVSWITPSPSSGAGTSDVSLTYASTLPAGVHTGRITVSTANITRVIEVTRTVLRSEFSLLQTDRRHNRVLGLVRGSSGETSALVAIHPESLAIQDVVALPPDITGMDLTADERTLYAISYAGRSISRVNLDDFTLVATKSIPTASTFGTYYQVQAGREGIVYYTDAASNPALHVFDFNGGVDVSTFYLEGLVGIGDFKVTPDAQTLYARSYTGSSVSGRAFLARVNCGSNTLTQSAATSAVLVQDNIRHPVLLSANLDSVITQGQFFSTANLAGGIQGTLTPNKIYNTSAYLDALVTDSQIIGGHSGQVLHSLPVTTTVTAFSPDQSKLIYSDTSNQTLGVVDTPELPSIAITPGIASGSIQNADFRTLSWSGDPSVARYDIYLGTDPQAVDEAVYGLSSSFLVTTPATSFQTSVGQLALGQTYYWRVDARAADDSVSKGEVWSFRMSPAGANPGSISGYALPGSSVVQEVPLQVVTSSSGVAWTLSSDSSWVTLSQTSGSGPSTVTVSLNPAGLAAGTTQASLTLSSGADVISIPVSFEILGALNITRLKADPSLPMTYALHREPTSPYSSWLLWVNPLTAAVEHGVRVGNGAVDFTVHAGDDRLYVLVEDGRRVQGLERQGPPRQPLTSYAISPPQVALHTTSVGRMVTLSAANVLQLRQSSNGNAVGSGLQVLGRNSLTVAKADGLDIYAAVTQSSTNVGLARYAVTGSGLAFVTANYFSGSLESPLLISADGSRLIYGRSTYAPMNLDFLASLGQRIHAVSATGAVVISDSTVYSSALPLVPLAPLPFATPTMALTADGSRLLLYSPTTRSFQSMVMP